MNDSIERILFTEEEIKEATAKVASEISRDYKDAEGTTVLLCILKGSLVFCSDLMRKLDFPTELEFMKVSSYGSGTISSGQLNITLDISRKDLSDINIIIVEDIIDTGITLSRIHDMLVKRGAKSVKTVALLNNPARRGTPYEPDYSGLFMPNEFVVGYGLDYNEKFRDLPYIGVLKPEIYKR
ncbi:MAG: hypoxanthine phosphoribosyltransferase [Clostridia bacterium]|nr:hypoxanthine phosphoribosyltransferase [Clostridia bacterium]